MKSNYHMIRNARRAFIATHLNERGPAPMALVRYEERALVGRIRSYRYCADEIPHPADRQ
jgi:hypothetical protein